MATARVAVLSLLWGSSFLWVDLALAAFNPVLITLARLVLGAATLFALAPRRLLSTLRDDRLRPRLAVAAVVATGGPYLLFASAQLFIPANVTGALNATTPIWALLLALATRTQRTTTVVQVTGLVAGFAGVLIILQPWNDALGDLAALGALLALTAAACYGIGYVYVAARITPSGRDGLGLAGAQIALAGGVLTVPATVGAAVQPPTWNSLTPLIALLILGVGGTGLAYGLLYRIITDDGPVAAAAVTYLLSVVAVILATLVLRDPLTPELVAGVALVLLGVALTRRGTPVPDRMRVADEGPRRPHSHDGSPARRT